MSKPIILVSSELHIEEGIHRVGVNADYSNTLFELGAIPLILPIREISAKDNYDEVAERILQDADGLLMTGGEDVNADMYGEDNIPENMWISEERDYFELSLIRAAITKQIPLLGVCRGMQLTNVALGGSLVQDISNGSMQHKQCAAGYSAAHTIDLEPDSLFASIIGEKRVRVNSFHHQKIARLAEGLAVSAQASDQTIEAVEARGPTKFGVANRFTVGVQYHPEQMWNRHPHAKALLCAFIEAAAERGKKDR